MRSIGKLDSEQQAATLHDYLFVRGIENEIEQNADQKWTVWVHDEDRIEEVYSIAVRVEPPGRETGLRIVPIGRRGYSKRTNR